MLHICCNPSSGSGMLRSAAVCHELRKSSIPYLLHTKGTPEELEKEFPDWHLSAADTLMVIGGDGSFNEILRLLPEKDAPPLILLPSGSGNDFARGIGMKRGDAAALRLIRERENLLPCPLDCGEAVILSSSGETGSPLPRRFAVSCGIGYDAGVTREVNRGRLKAWMNRLHMGRIAYLLLGIRGIFRYKKASGSLTLDGSRKISFRHLAFLSCHNLPYEGGGFAFAPGASARDGQLNICVVTARSRLGFTLTLAASLLKLHTHLPNVHLYTCREAEIRTDTPLPFHTDGDACPEVTGFRIRVLPHRFTLLFEPGNDLPRYELHTEVLPSPHS